MPLAFRYSAVSASVKGNRRMVLLTRLCNPPLLLMMLSIIQEAAEPQITTFSFGWREAQVFHQWPNASRNPDRAVCIQGNSSNKTTSGCLLNLVFIKSVKKINACTQLVGVAGGMAEPIASCKARLKLNN